MFKLNFQIKCHEKEVDLRLIETVGDDPKKEIAKEDEEENDQGIALLYHSMDIFCLHSNNSCGGCI